MVQKQVKVGIFVLSGLALLTVAVFMIGDNSHFWDSKVTYTAPFKDVQGLKPGAPVRLGGVDIGTVSSVGYDKQASDDRIFVKLALVKSEAERIRQGSVAHIVNKGLLGDKMVDLSTDGKGSPLPSGGVLQTSEPIDFTSGLVDSSR